MFPMCAFAKNTCKTHCFSPWLGHPFDDGSFLLLCYILCSYLLMIAIYVWVLDNGDTHTHTHTHTHMHISQMHLTCCWSSPFAFCNDLFLSIMECFNNGVFDFCSIFSWRKWPVQQVQLFRVPKRPSTCVSNGGEEKETKQKICCQGLVYWGEHYSF